MRGGCYRHMLAQTWVFVAPPAVAGAEGVEVEAIVGVEEWEELQEEFEDLFLRSNEWHLLSAKSLLLNYVFS